MKTLNIIIAFCFGLMLGYFFFKSRHEIRSIDNEPLITHAKSELQLIDTNKSAKDKRFNLIVDSLKKLLLQTQSHLIVSKEHLKNEQEKVDQLVFQLKSNNLSNTDTILLDSLHFSIQAMYGNTDTIIENYERKLKLTNNLVAVRDSQLILCHKSYSDVKSLMEEQWLREQKLNADLNSTLKELRNKRNQNKVLCAGMLFVAGLTTALFIKARQ